MTNTWEQVGQAAAAGAMAGMQAGGMTINDNVTCEYHDNTDHQVGYDKTHNGVLTEYDGVEGTHSSVNHVHVYSDTSRTYSQPK